jgi:hypothetical protein
MSGAPRATVLTAVYNGAPWLAQSLDSVLTQEFTDFELVVVDDASSDESPAILAAVADPRLRVLRNPRNLGLTASLNRGLELARGDVILRHDADDLSLPGRFARQMALLDARPEVGVCGGFATMVDGQGRPLDIYRVPADHGPIAWAVGFGHAFAHPAVAVRTGLLRAASGYDPHWPVAQDQELWTRLVWTTRMVNIPEPLVAYRQHAGMASRARGAEQRDGDLRARGQFLERLLGREVPPELLRWNSVPPLPGAPGRPAGADARELAGFARVVLEALGAVRRRFCATRAEAGAVGRLAGRKLHALSAGAAGAGASLLAARLLARAVTLDPSLLAPAELARAGRAALRAVGARSARSGGRP